MKPEKDSGFSLIEVMAVLFIIGLIVGSVILTMPERKSQFEKQSDRFIVEIRSIIEDGLITGHVTALSVNDEGYSLYEYKSGEWETLKDSSWALDYKVELKRDGVTLKLPEQREPQIVFQPIGQSSSFALTLDDGDQEHQFISLGQSRIDRIITQ